MGMLQYTIRYLSYAAVLQSIALHLYDVVAVMQTVDASNNSFSGALPATVLEGIWLQSFDYSANNLTGSIASNVTSFLLEVSTSNQVKQCVGLQTCTK